MDRLRQALQRLFGGALDRPDTPARIEHALLLFLACASARPPRVMRRPAALSAPESWELRLDGTDRATAAAVRDAARTGSSHDRGAVCLQCGTPSDQGRGTFCRRCGLPYGQPPRATVELPTCPICYQTVDDDGRLPSLERAGLRVDLVRHQAEHERHPVGDDEWLESLRRATGS